MLTIIVTSIVSTLITAMGAKVGMWFIRNSLVSVREKVKSSIIDEAKLLLEDSSTGTPETPKRKHSPSKRARLHKALDTGVKIVENVDHALSFICGLGWVLLAFATMALSLSFLLTPGKKKEEEKKQKFLNKVVLLKKKVGPKRVPEVESLEAFSQKAQVFSSITVRAARLIAAMCAVVAVPLIGLKDAASFGSSMRTIIDGVNVILETLGLKPHGWNAEEKCLAEEKGKAPIRAGMYSVWTARLHYEYLSADNMVIPEPGEIYVQHKPGFSADEDVIRKYSDGVWDGPVTHKRIAQCSNCRLRFSDINLARKHVNERENDCCPMGFSDAESPVEFSAPENILTRLVFSSKSFFSSLWSGAVLYYPFVIFGALSAVCVFFIFFYFIGNVKTQEWNKLKKKRKGLEAVIQRKKMTKKIQQTAEPKKKEEDEVRILPPVKERDEYGKEAGGKKRKNFYPGDEDEWVHEKEFEKFWDRKVEPWERRQRERDYEFTQKFDKFLDLVERYERSGKRESKPELQLVDGPKKCKKCGQFAKKGKDVCKKCNPESEELKKEIKKTKDSPKELKKEIKEIKESLAVNTKKLAAETLACAAAIHPREYNRKPDGSFENLKQGVAIGSAFVSCHHGPASDLHVECTGLNLTKLDSAKADFPDEDFTVYPQPKGMANQALSLKHVREPKSTDKFVTVLLYDPKAGHVRESNGKVLSLRKIGSGKSERWEVEHEAPTVPGWSGGAIISNSDGALIGIHNRGRHGPGGFGISLPVRVRDVINSIPKQAK